MSPESVWDGLGNVPVIQIKFGFGKMGDSGDGSRSGCGGDNRNSISAHWPTTQMPSMWPVRPQFCYLRATLIAWVVLLVIE